MATRWEVSPALDLHASAHHPPWQRLHAGPEADQAILAHRARVAVADQVGAFGHGPESDPIPLDPHGDHLAMRAVNLGPASRQSSQKGIVYLARRGEVPAVQHAVAHDRHLAPTRLLNGGRRAGATTIEMP